MASTNDLGDFVAALQRKGRYVVLVIFLLSLLGVVVHSLVLPPSHSNAFMALVYATNALICLVGWILGRKREIPKTYSRAELVAAFHDGARLALVVFALLSAVGFIVHAFVLPARYASSFMVVVYGACAVLCFGSWLWARRRDPERRSDP